MHKKGLSLTCLAPFLAVTFVVMLELVDRQPKCKHTSKGDVTVHYSQTGCSVPRNIARLPSILQCSCANCSEQVAPELASCNYISFNKFVDFNTFLADFR